jgi:pimeloyl-ACP methyl ester carboxylesterase
MTATVKKILSMVAVVIALTPVLAGNLHAQTRYVFVGGWRTLPAQMESLSRSVPDSLKVQYFLPEKITELIRPWHCADLLYDFIRSNGLADDDLVFVAFSLGGIVTQRLVRDHPELQVRKLVLVAAPMGGYRRVFPSNPFFLNEFPRDLPVYVIAGVRGQRVWYLQSNNDGAVDLASALDVPAQNLKGVAVFDASHNDLQEIAGVQDKLVEWLDVGSDPSHGALAEFQSAKLDSPTSTSVAGLQN